MSHIEHKPDRMITLIALFKIIKGVLVLGLAAGTFALIGRDVDELLSGLISIFRLSPENRLVEFLYRHMNDLTDGKLKIMGSVEVLYGSLQLTEGYGLYFRRKWAELLTIVATSIPIPYEIYELIEKPKLFKIIVLVLNSALVWYLWNKRREFLSRKERRAIQEEKSLN